MSFIKFTVFVTLVALGGRVNAQFPPIPEGIQVLESQIEKGIRISYKEVSPLFKSRHSKITNSMRMFSCYVSW